MKIKTLHSSLNNHNLEKLPMKDQNTIQNPENNIDKWNRGLDLFIESVYKPDSELRQCARNQKCHDELMEIRNEVLRYLPSLRKK